MKALVAWTALMAVGVFTTLPSIAGVFLAAGTTRIEGTTFGATGPQGISYHAGNGTLFVADRSNQVFEIDLAGNLQQSFSTAGFMPGTPSTVGIVCDPVTGNLLLADGAQVFEVETDGSNPSLFFDLSQTASGDSKGIAVHPVTGNIWIADDDADRIFEFDRTTPVPNLLSSISTTGLLPGFFEPEGLAFLGTDLIVSDDGNASETLYLVSTSGVLLQTIVDVEDAGLADPEGVANITDSRICAAGDDDNAILCFDVTGCGPAGSVDWEVSWDCTMAQNGTASADVVVQENVSLTIGAGVALDIDFSAHRISVKNGAKVVIKPGGKIH